VYNNFVKYVFKVCVTCKHLEVLERGFEFPGILDSEYIVFNCEKFGIKQREDYLMAPVKEDLGDFNRKEECPFWEDWREKEEEV